jgi:hypothetical protein
LFTVLVDEGADVVDDELAVFESARPSLLGVVRCEG